MAILNLAWQEAEFRMERRPLPHDLAPDARILDLVGGRAREMIGGDVADHVARRLHGMHVDFGQRRQRVRRILELDPVELQVLARREMAITRSYLREMSASLRSWCDDNVPYGIAIRSI